MEKGQIKSLSDIVFGLAISIGGIGFIYSVPSDKNAVINGMAWFALGFLILIVLWVNYTRVMDETEIESPWDMMLNVVLLLCVSIEPIFLNIISSGTMDDFATMIYAIDVGTMLIIFSVFYHWIVEDKTREGKHDEMMEFRHLRVIRIADGGIFYLSILPFFWNNMLFGIHLRFIVWFLAIVPAMLVWYHNYRVHRPKPGTASTKAGASK